MVPQYRWTTASGNTVHVSLDAARVFVVESSHKEAHKAQNDSEERFDYDAEILLCFDFVLFVPFCG